MAIFSRTAEYALRAVLLLAEQTGPDGQASLTTPQIARAIRVPGGYLAKVLGQLVRAGLLRSRRGLHGGFAIAQAPADIRLLDVINAVEPIHRFHLCPLELPTHAWTRRPLHRRLDDAIAAIEKALADSTIADLLADASPNRPRGDATRPRRQVAAAADDDGVGVSSHVIQDL